MQHLAERHVASDIAAADMLGRALEGAGFTVFPADSLLRPTITAAHPVKGMLAVDVVDGEPDAGKELNRKVAQLRADVPDLEAVKVSRRVVDVSVACSDAKILSVADAVAGAWIQRLPERPLEEELLNRLQLLLAPAFTFVSPRRGLLTDEGSTQRAARRVVLDAQQAAIATVDVAGVMLLTGPPGSGKTLVLAARARWLAEQHPDWTIQMLCFNRLLVPYLQALVSDWPNVQVQTFGKFSYGLGFRISLDDETASARNVARALKDAYPRVDAFLVDEAQDFFPSWMDLLRALIFPGRGGIVIAGDPKQALYRDGDFGGAIEGSSLKVATLTIPYRSTRQILEVTSALDPSLDVDGRDGALEGMPVDLVWAENLAEQAAAVARDVRMLLDAGERAPENIGILYTRRWQLGSLARALDAEGVPHQVVLPKEATVEFLTSPTVKLITVHSSKGYEFDVVFLVGLEQLPDPDGSADNARQGRTGYVGATRARDQLVITFSKPTTYLERVRSVPEEMLRRWVWPNDYPEV